MGFQNFLACFFIFGRKFLSFLFKSHLIICNRCHRQPKQVKNRIVLSSDDDGETQIWMRGCVPLLLFLLELYKILNDLLLYNFAVFV